MICVKKYKIKLIHDFFLSFFLIYQSFIYSFIMYLPIHSFIYLFSFEWDNFVSHERGARVFVCVCILCESDYQWIVSLLANPPVD